MHRLQALRLLEDAAKAERARHVAPAARMQVANGPAVAEKAKLLPESAAERGLWARLEGAKDGRRRRMAEAEAAAAPRPHSPSELRGRTRRASPRRRTRRGMANAAHAILSPTGRAELRRRHARRASLRRRRRSVPEVQVEAVRANPNILV